MDINTSSSYLVVQNFIPDYKITKTVNVPTSHITIKGYIPYPKRVETDLFGIDESWIEKKSADINGIDESWVENKSGDLAGYDESWIEKKDGDVSGYSESWIEIKSGNLAGYDERWSELSWARSESTITHASLHTVHAIPTEHALHSHGMNVSSSILLTVHTSAESRALCSPAWQIKLPSLVTVTLIARQSVLFPVTSQSIISTSANAYNLISNIQNLSVGALNQVDLIQRADTLTPIVKDLSLSLSAYLYNKLIYELIVSQQSLLEIQVKVSDSTLQDLTRYLIVAMTANTLNSTQVNLVLAQAALIQCLVANSLQTLSELSKTFTISHAGLQYNALKRVLILQTGAIVSTLVNLSSETRSCIESHLVASTSADSLNKVTSTVTITLAVPLCSEMTVGNYTLSPVQCDCVLATDALNYYALQKITTCSISALNALSLIPNSSTLEEIQIFLQCSMQADDYNKLYKHLNVVQSALNCSNIKASSATLTEIPLSCTIKSEALQYFRLSQSEQFSSNSVAVNSVVFTLDTLQPIYKYTISSESIRTPLSVIKNFSLTSNDRNAHTIVLTHTSSTEPENVVISNFETYITHKGVRYEIIDLVLRDTIQSFLWQGSIELAQPNAYTAIKINDDIDLYYFGQVFKLMVEKKTLTRDNFIQPSMVIDVLSRTARLGTPFTTETINETFVTSTASDIALNITPLSWEMVDWVIRSGRLAVEGMPPIEVIQKIVAAAGGMLLTTRGGTLVAKPIFSTVPWSWSLATSVGELTDFADNISYSESYQKVSAYSKITVTDSDERTWSIRSESVGNDPTKAIIIVVSYPWCDNIELIHTSHAGITIVPQGTKIWSPRDDTNNYETVEFKGNTATTQYPIYQLNSYQYTHKNLGAMTFDIDTSLLMTNDQSGLSVGYSIARIHYLTRDIRFSVSGLIPGETSQFLAIEV